MAENTHSLSPDQVAHLERTKAFLGARGILPDTPNGLFSRELLDRECMRRGWEWAFVLHDSGYLATLTKITSGTEKGASGTASGPTPDWAVAHALVTAIMLDEGRERQQRDRASR